MPVANSGLAVGGASPQRGYISMLLVERYGPLLARILLSTIFILSGIGKITNTSFDADQMRAKGLPAVVLLLVVALVIELAGGVSVLLGLKARLGASRLFLYLIPVTLIMHDFWAYTGPERVHQLENFLKNVAIMGGLMLIAAFGPGPISVDQR